MRLQRSVLDRIEEEHFGETPVSQRLGVLPIVLALLRLLRQHRRTRIGDDRLVPHRASYDLIRADQDKTGCTVVAVSSDVDGLMGFVDNIAMIYDGVIRFSGSADDIRDTDDALVRQFVRGDLEGPLP